MSLVGMRNSYMRYCLGYESVTPPAHTQNRDVHTGCDGVTPPPSSHPELGRSHRTLRCDNPPRTHTQNRDIHTGPYGVTSPPAALTPRTEMFTQDLPQVPAWLVPGHLPK